MSTAESPRPWGFLPVLLVLVSGGGATGQELVHHAQDARGSLDQLVRLVDPWEGGDGDGFFKSEPRDVEVRIRRRDRGEESESIQLLLHGAWGWHHLAYDERAEHGDELGGVGVRTYRTPVDVDGDGETEIVLLGVTVRTRTPVDEYGHPLEDEAGPRFAGVELRLRYLDREGDSLVEHDLTADPEAPGFARLLERELGGDAAAALQLMAGDHAFDSEDYADARYRYRVVREWAERALESSVVADLSPSMTLTRADPDDPSFAWIAALERIAALPPHYRRGLP